MPVFKRQKMQKNYVESQARLKERCNDMAFSGKHAG